MIGAAKGPDEPGPRVVVLHVRRGTLRAVVAVGTLVVVFLVVVAVSWGRLALEAQRARVLEETVARLSSQEDRVADLALQLDSIASAYDDVRSFFGSAVTPGSGDLWLPPGSGRPSARALPSGDDEGSLPSEWPLTQAGFLTRSPAAGGTEDHPGIDVAVPAGPYIRAAGSGTVLEAGEDEIYGFYVTVDHGEGYHSLYGHASLLVVAPGTSVRRGEVIALSGSSGRSTAPHLHFEILENGTPIDPLTLLAQP